MAATVLMMRNVMCVDSFHDVGDSRTMPYPYTLPAALLLTSVCIFGGRLRARSHHHGGFPSLPEYPLLASMSTSCRPFLKSKQSSPPTPRLVPPFSRVSLCSLHSCIRQRTVDRSGSDVRARPGPFADFQDLRSCCISLCTLKLKSPS